MSYKTGPQRARNMIAFVTHAMTFATDVVDKVKDYVWTLWVSGLQMEKRDSKTTDRRQTLVYQEMANACKECIYESTELDDFRERLLWACERKLMWV